MAAAMQWIGTWRNQFGSVIDITDQDGGRIAGRFRSALADSSFHGVDAPISGTHDGDAVSFSAARSGTAVSYTGMLVDGRLETIWIIVDADADWWRSITTNHDTFLRG